MSEISSERLEPTAPVPERLGDTPRREPGPRSRRQPPPQTPDSPEAVEASEAPPHQVDSLA
ncbi:MAG: hypothetical protein LAO09_13325 [Acidobacteriia bacterium]|nr:hypothetical protein [Terriglobia bacterium]